MKNKKLNGNISVLVILILLACSVISLLAISQIQRLITYGNQTYNYFRAYYIAKAGMEASLTDVYLREDGYNSSIHSGDSIVNSNFIKEFSGLKIDEGTTLSGDYSGFEPYFDSAISGSFKYITNDVKSSSDCTDKNAITLGIGDGIVLSLFNDETEEHFQTESDNSPKFKEYEKLIIDWPSNSTNLTFGIFQLDGSGFVTDDISIREDNQLIFNGDLKEIINKSDFNKELKTYLTIRNSSNEEARFCISAKGAEIPSPDSLITVRGHYGNMEVGLQSIVKGKTPSRALDVLDY